MQFNIESKIKIGSTIVSKETFDRECFLRSSHENHLKQLNIADEKSGAEIYKNNGMRHIPIEMREGQGEFEWIKKYAESDLITDQDLRGCLHNHSTYSDGIHTLSEMATHLQRLGFEYFGISDHSKTAVYAGGLKEDDVVRQNEEIDALNQKMAPFRILKGIESDILSNGDLDYDESVLKTFDFIVASIHSAMKMDEERATSRLIKAIENPYTKILGHPTGRLLLSRPGILLITKK